MTMRNPWLRVGFGVWSLGVEAFAVVSLRTFKIAAGGSAAQAEARQMISEKLEAGWTLQTLALTGRLGFSLHGAAAKTISHYRRKVRANQRRLAKSCS
jgi:hypothetical protein